MSVLDSLSIHQLSSRWLLGKKIKSLVPTFATSCLRKVFLYVSQLPCAPYLLVLGLVKTCWFSNYSKISIEVCIEFVGPWNKFGYWSPKFDFGFRKGIQNLTSVPIFWKSNLMIPTRALVGELSSRTSCQGIFAFLCNFPRQKSFNFVTKSKNVADIQS